MDNSTLTRSLADFIEATPGAFNAAQNLRGILSKAGFTELDTTAKWQLTPGKGYFAVFSDSAVIAFKPGHAPGFMITASHTDSPSFRLKPNPVIEENGYVKFNTDPYGGAIYHSWLDRPLSLCGRAVFEHEGKLHTHIINIDRDLAVIPSLAIHLNREANRSLALNPQVDMLPVIALGGFSGIEDLLKSECGCKGELLDCDLFLYLREKVRFAGVNGEIILAPRLDDLASVHTCLTAFIEAECPVTSVFCAFNNEETGSRTVAGAGSTLLAQVTQRISDALGQDHFSALMQSMLVSADNAHALHPNCPAKSDPTNKVKLGGGVAIKRHDHYTTDGYSASVFKSICKKAGAKYQDFASRSDGSCGGTLGAISLGQVTVSSVDIGIPQLAMHSAVETAATSDLYDIYLAVKEFYNSRIG